MDIKDKIIIVTGGAKGIGKALCQRFAEEEARKIIVVDLDSEKIDKIAAKIDGIAFEADVTNESEITRIIHETEKRFGYIDLYCSNAGIAVADTPDYSVGAASNESWLLSWNVNVMAHVYAARAALPRMIERGKGYFLVTASAAGLLSMIGSASYSATKHAAIGFSESLAIMHRDQGIGVSVLCPQAVNTDMLAVIDANAASVDGILQPEEIAEYTVGGLREESFLILPHQSVKTYMTHKSADYNRWIKNMNKFKCSLYQ